MRIRARRCFKLELTMVCEIRRMRTCVDHAHLFREATRREKESNLYTCLGKLLSNFKRS